MRKWIVGLLLVAGIAGVGFWAWSTVRYAVYQRRENRAFDRQVRGASPPAAAEPSREAGSPILGRLAIPRLHLRAIVREGDGDDTLAVALGHVAGTALPGEAGNTAIAGHRDTLFRSLRNISRDDVIVFQTTHGSYTYHVEDMSIVKPQDVAVLAPRSYPEITLITCYPFYYVGPAPKRFIVRARLTNPAR